MKSSLANQPSAIDVFSTFVLIDNCFSWAAGVAWWSSALTLSRKGCAFHPKPRQPLSHSRDWCFAPLPGSGWQVLLNFQDGSIGSEILDILQKLVAGRPEPGPQKKNCFSLSINKESNLVKGESAVFSFFTDDNSGVHKGVVCATLLSKQPQIVFIQSTSKPTKSVNWVAKSAKSITGFIHLYSRHYL
jgi:hypothetical protein